MRLGFILIFLALLSYGPALAQPKTPKSPALSQCTVTIDKVPFIRGLRLGQPYAHLKTVLPRRYEFDRSDEYGLRRVLVSPRVLADPDKLSGIDTMSLLYFDDSLVSLEIYYKSDVPWQSNLHFVAAIADQLNLPREGWRQRDPSYLVCQGFLVEVSGASLLPRLRLVDIQFPEELSKRKAKIEQEKRARFRP